MDQELIETTRRGFGQAMRARRKALGMSQEELGALAHLEQSYVSDVEAGKRNVSIDNIARIAKALGVPVAALFGGEQSP
jgi:transcriptional regulator with XRE-family HTH domain